MLIFRHLKGFKIELPRILGIEFAQNIGSDEIISTDGALAEGLLKKVAVLLDFVQLRGEEGPAQIFCPLFTNAL